MLFSGLLMTDIKMILSQNLNQCVSRLARRKSHHTALSNATVPNSECPCHAPTQLIRRSHSPRSNATALPPPWLPASQCSPKGEKTCPDSRATCMQNFTSLAFSAAEKSATIQTKNNKQTNKHTVNLSIPHTTIRWDKKYKLKNQMLLLEVCQQYTINLLIFIHDFAWREWRWLCLAQLTCTIQRISGWNWFFHNIF